LKNQSDKTGLSAAMVVRRALEEWFKETGLKFGAP